jgi:hypothetical protein
MAPVKHFQFTYNLALIEAEKKIVDGQELYTLNFSNEIPPVTLKAIKLPDGAFEWDSVPPGNMELATSLGNLIEQYHEQHGTGDTDE